jgi:hypothetical protein
MAENLQNFIEQLVAAGELLLIPAVGPESPKGIRAT